MLIFSQFLRKSLRIVDSEDRAKTFPVILSAIMRSIGYGYHYKCKSYWYKSNRSILWNALIQAIHYILWNYHLANPTINIAHFCVWFITHHVGLIDRALYKLWRLGIIFFTYMYSNHSLVYLTNTIPHPMTS